MTLSFLIQALRRHLLLGLITVVAVTGIGITIGAAWPKTYTSHAGILLGLDLKGSRIDPQTANLYLKDRVATYAELVTSDGVITPVAEAAQLAPEDLRQRIVVVIVPETVVLEVSVTGSTPAQAVELTRAVTRNFNTQVSSYNVRTGGPEVLPAQIFTPQPAQDPDQLHGALLVGIAALVGVLMGILLPLVVALAAAGRAHRLSRLRQPLSPPRRDASGSESEGEQEAPVWANGRKVANWTRRRGSRSTPQPVDWDQVDR